jgi:hypothetical protein
MRSRRVNDRNNDGRAVAVRGCGFVWRDWLSGCERDGRGENAASAQHAQIAAALEIAMLN